MTGHTLQPLFSEHHNLLQWTTAYTVPEWMQEVQLDRLHHALWMMESFTCFSFTAERVISENPHTKLFSRDYLFSVNFNTLNRSMSRLQWWWWCHIWKCRCWSHSEDMRESLLTLRFLYKRSIKVRTDVPWKEAVLRNRVFVHWYQYINSVFFVSFFPLFEIPKQLYNITVTQGKTVVSGWRAKLLQSCVINVQSPCLLKLLLWRQGPGLRSVTVSCCLQSDFGASILR